MITTESKNTVAYKFSPSRLGLGLGVLVGHGVLGLRSDHDSTGGMPTHTTGMASQVKRDMGVSESVSEAIRKLRCARDHENKAVVCRRVNIEGFIVAHVIQRLHVSL